MNWKARVKDLLAEQNMSQTDLGNRLGVSRATISLWLGDKNSYTDHSTIKMQNKIAEVLGTTREYLESGKRFTTTTGRVVPLLKSPEDIEAWCLRKLDATEAQKLYCPIDCSVMTYATVMTSKAMEGDSNSAGIPMESIVYVDHAIPLSQNNICIFKQVSLLIGRYEEIGGKPTVIFNNYNYPAITLDAVTYFGTLVGAFSPFSTASTATTPLISNIA
ncbi:helix-turn-helix transcriptional regulator [Endozoicomonas euniceicola]|uniref:Helix-turn-helix domain-containing protein n=1 Tax=Endozoicomonas euniceicola TaxID=1234143 RepID=A0ABY6GTW5_9GAMM|nr:helix-turn-helix transcriptional regulator [Endozoicomonas euniceicola]UYM16221.1 helix-turn-helix domain-containing protein [Endozoicomonas euniceicola]